jgi:hypothetical protein
MFLYSWQASVGLCVVALTAYLLRLLLQRWNHQRFLQQFPIAKIKNGDLKGTILEYSTKYPDSPWILPAKSPRIFLPNRVLNEIRFLPSDQVSLRKEVYKKLHGRYTSLGLDHPEGIAAIKLDLTANIGRMLPALQEESIYALNREFGNIGQEWTQVAVYPRLLQLAALVNGRMFVGLPLARDQDWIDLNIKYTLDVVSTVRAVGKIRPMFRRIQAPLLPEVKHLAAYKKRAEVILRPHIAATIEAKKEMDGKKDNDKLKFNLIAWMLDQMQGVDYQLLAGEQLFACKSA